MTQHIRESVDYIYEALHSIAVSLDMIEAYIHRDVSTPVAGDPKAGTTRLNAALTSLAESAINIPDDPEPPS